ncbi:hypothetical protein FBU30_008684 [Linnemannia zychae]|nr:hypothetical protein FBU30_008684 [Linnemannia zychae]
MSFSLTSPELLDLDSYQRTLKQLVKGLVALHNKNNNKNNSNIATGGPIPSEAAATATAASTLEVNLGTGAAFILDMTLADNNTMATLNNEASRQIPLQSYPLSFVATGQLPVLRTPPVLEPNPTSFSLKHTTAQALPVLYYIRLPWNPQTHGIQCQLSARRLASHHVTIVDRILRQLCDASPGAFMIGYSDGLSGIDAGTEVVYSGESSRHNQRHFHHHTPGLDKSIAIARNRGDMDLDHRVAGLVGHVEHHHHHHSLPPTTETALPSVLLKKSIMDLKEDVNTFQEQSPPLQQENSSITSATAHVQDDTNIIKMGGDDILNHDFGLWEDVDQWAHAHWSLDIDHLHDSLWGCSS